MKKRLSLVLGLLLIFSLIMTGCGTVKKDEIQDADKDETTILEENKEIELPEIVVEDVLDSSANEKVVNNEQEVNETVKEFEIDKNEEPFVKKENSDFQNSNWGDSIEAVKFDNRDLDILQDGDTLWTTASVAGKDADIFFAFENNQLVQGVVSFSEKHSNDFSYISDFETIKELLVEKYGEPVEDDEAWLNDLFKDDPMDYGLAVAAGHLIYRVIWETSDTQITLLLTGDNYDIMHFISYSPLGYEVKTDNSRL